MTIINPMRTFLRIISITIFLLFFTPLSADNLDDFKDHVEQEEEENSQNEDVETDREEVDDDESESSSFMDFLWEFTFLLWFIHNETVYYTPYPYESDGMIMGDNYIGHDRRNREDLYADKNITKDYNFALYGGGSFNETIDEFGGFFRLSGKFFNHLGPEIDYRLIYNGNEVFHNLSTGINLSFFQFDYLSLDFYVKGAFFMGLLQRQGISLGARFTSYPFKPVSLELRSGGVFFESLKFAELEAKLGIHINAVEIFGNFYTLQSKKSQLYSIGIGAGVHF